MVKLKHERMSSLWIQYFLSYFIIIIIFVISITGYIYGEFYKFHKEILLREYQGSLELIRKTNESELSLLISSSNQLAASSDVKSFIYTKNPEKNIPLRRQLSFFSGCNDFFDSMYLIFDSDDYVFSPTSTCKIDYFANTVMHFDSVSPEELISRIRSAKWLEVLPEQEYYPLLLNAKKKIIPIIVPIGFSEGYRHGAILYEIDSNQYEKTLAGIATGDKNVYVFSGEEVVFARETIKVPKEIIQEYSMDTIDAEAVTEVVYNGQKYWLFGLAGSELNLSYFMLAPAGDIGSSVGITMQFFLIIIAVVFAVCLMLVVYFVQLRVKPIRNLYNMIVKSKPKGKGNGLNEIQKGVQNLIYDNIELNNRINSLETLKKVDFALKFLSGFSGGDEWRSLADEIELNTSFKYFSVGILAKPAGSEYSLVPEKLNNIFDGEISGVSCKLGPDAKAIIILFAHKENEIHDWVENKFKDMRIYCPGLTMAISDVHADYKEGSIAYLEAENAFERRFIHGNSSVLHFDAVQSVKGDIAYDQKPVERLRLAFKFMDEKRITNALDEISKAMRTMNTSLFMFRCLYNDILNVITKEAHDNPGLEREVYNLFQLSECLSLDDLDIMLKKVCMKLIEEHNNISSKDVSPQIKKAMEIIKKRFSDPNISLSVIADELCIYESQLSVEFKAAYKVSPYDFIVYLRMEQACKLLRNTNMPVKDIAMECGNYEISAFNRRFKTYTGKTPQQYRKANL